MTTYYENDWTCAYSMTCTVLKSYEIRAKRFMNAVPTRPQAASASVKGAAESLAKRGCAHSFPTMTWTTTFMTLGLKKLQHKHDKTWTWTTTSAFGRILPFQTTPTISQQQKCRKQTVPLEPPRSYWEGWQPWQISTCEPICRHNSLEDEPGMLSWLREVLPTNQKPSDELMEHWVKLNLSRLDKLEY